MATKLRAMVDGRGIKQAWIARQLGVDPAVVNRWCDGLEIPEKYRAKLAALLWVKVRDVVGDVEVKS